MNLRDLTAKYKGMIIELNKSRETNCLIIAKDAFALASNRIQNIGVNAEGQKLGGYSKKHMPWWFLNPSRYTGAGKIEKFKKDARAEEARAKKENREPSPDKTSYYGLRKAYGLPVDKKTLTFTEAMFSDIVQEVEKKTDTSITIVIKAKTKTEQDKVNFNSAREKTNILSLSDNEKAIVHEANVVRINKILKK